MPTHNLNKKRIAVSVNLKLNALEKSDKKPSALKSYCAITGGKETVEVPNNEIKSLHCRATAPGACIPQQKPWLGWRMRKVGISFAGTQGTAVAQSWKTWRRAHTGAKVGQWDSKGSPSLGLPPSFFLPASLATRVWSQDPGRRTNSTQSFSHCHVCVVARVCAHSARVSVCVHTCTHR